MTRPTKLRLRPDPGRLMGLLVGMTLLVSCSGAAAPGASPSPSPGATPAASISGPIGSPDDATACAPTASGAPAYPGWPGAPDFQNPTDFIPTLVSSELAVGENRFLLTLIDDQNEPLASADVDVELRFYELATEPAQPAVTVPATFLPVDERNGLYRAAVEFTCSGEWGVEVVARQAGVADRSARVIFPVRPESSTPAVGDLVPPTSTPTADDPVTIASISTDDDPDPDFYRTSVDDAITSSEPFVVVFATPAFCQTRTCAPALDHVKAAADEYKDGLTFIHVEPYELEERDGQLQPVLVDGQLDPVPAVDEWGLLTEPYTFVVDGDARVVAKFEGIAGQDELRAAFEDAARS